MTSTTRLREFLTERSEDQEEEDRAGPDCGPQSAALFIDQFFLIFPIFL
jgi:hypothetical protein